MKLNPSACERLLCNEYRLTLIDGMDDHVSNLVALIAVATNEESLSFLETKTIQSYLRILENEIVRLDETWRKLSQLLNTC